MAKKPDNIGKRWSDAEVKQLQKLADQNTPTRVMGLKLEPDRGCGPVEGRGGGDFSQADESTPL